MFAEKQVPVTSARYNLILKNPPKTTTSSTLSRPAGIGRLFSQTVRQFTHAVVYQQYAGDL